MAISSTITHGITLATSGTYASPLAITKTGEIQAGSGDAIYGPNSQAWTVSNAGTVSATGTGNGIDLPLGGAITNASTGSIATSYTGILIEGSSGTVTNFGTITGSTEDGVELTAGGSVTNGQSGSTAGLISGRYFGVYVKGGLGTVANFGAISASAPGDGAGVLLVAGGSVTNASTGSIESQNTGIAITGSSGTVSNLGTVSGSGKGVSLEGGRVTNGQSGSSGGLISGFFDGVYVFSGVGTVANFGTITAASTGGVGVVLYAGGSVTNGGTGVINASISGGSFGVYIRGGIGTVSNFGTITEASGSGFGVELAAGGSVTNGASGLIAAGKVGVYITGGIGTVSNLGTISTFGPSSFRSFYDGILLSSGGSVTNGASASIEGFYGVVIAGGIGTVSNLGTVTGGVDGIRLNGGGSVTNGGTGDINASIHGDIGGVDVYGGGGTITNFGIISSSETGVLLDAGGTVIVNRYALVTATGRYGGGAIYISGGAGTVIASGAVSSGDGTAIHFSRLGTYNDLLILDPGVQIAGKVDGGSVNNTNTLELAAGAAAGTLSGLGTQFVGFGRVIVDSGANWTVDAAAPTSGQTIAASGGSDRLVFQTPGTIDLSGVSGFPTIVLAGLGANSTSLDNANLIGLSKPVITVIGGSFGNTVDASALTGSNRVILVGGLRPDHFTGGAGNDTFEFSAATSGPTDTVVGGAGSDELLMTSAGTVNAGGVRGVEKFQLASGAANSFTLKSVNFTGVSGHVITVDDGNSGNTITASTLPSADAIIVHAGTGTDTLKGGAGNDIFFAGGKTTMTGHGGANQFTFAHIGTNGITDFGASTSNKIVLRDSGFNLGADEALGTASLQHLAASVFVANSTGSFTTTGQRFAYNTTTGALRYDKDGSGASFSASTVVVLSGHPSLSAGASGKIFFIS
ncbi:MAG: hypothetical protein WA459_05315 [Stellaceae bacterium]